MTTAQPKRAHSEISSSGSTERCCFKPTKVSKGECDDAVFVRYGPFFFCSKHSSTTQAETAKSRHPPPPPAIVIPPPPITLEDLTPLVKEISLGKTVSKVRPAVKISPDVPFNSTITTSKNGTTLKRNRSPPPPSEVHVSKEAKKVEMDSTRTPGMDGIFENKWGRTEHRVTRIVFDTSNMYAYGVQDPRGVLLPLTDAHLAMCKKMGWKYYTTKDDEEDEDGDEKNEDDDSASSDPSEDEEDEEDGDEEESDDQSVDDGSVGSVVDEDDDDEEDDGSSDDTE